jgi:hypothetical protein
MNYSRLRLEVRSYNDECGGHVRRRCVLIHGREAAVSTGGADLVHEQRATSR